MSSHQLVSKQKISQLLSSIKENTITIIQGPSGCLKTSTITSNIKTHYIIDHKKYHKHFNNDSLQTDIDCKKELFEFITKLKGTNKIIIETRLSISNTELTKIQSMTKLKIGMVTFNAISTKKLQMLNNKKTFSMHNIKYNIEQIENLSIYHFLGRLFYKNVELNNLEMYEHEKVLKYVRQNYMFFMGDHYVLELISENIMYCGEIVVLYIGSVEKKRPKMFFGFNSLYEYTDEPKKKIIYFG